MIKKILILLLLFGFSGINFIQAGNYRDSEGNHWEKKSDRDNSNKEISEDKEDFKEVDEPKLCDTNPRNKINCSKFEIDTKVFTPGEGKILEKAKEGGGDTGKSANAILGVIIKNLIVVFGVLSLLMMTIGGGMMIFHAGQESILTRGKGIFVWGVASLAIGLASGLIVKLVSYILY